MNILKYKSLIIIITSLNISILHAKPKLNKNINVNAKYLENEKVWIWENEIFRKIWYSNGILHSEGVLKNKIRKGKWTFYFPSSILKAIGFMKMTSKMVNGFFLVKKEKAVRR